MHTLPSPTSSPSLTAQDTPLNTNSRKRLRSQSMQSDNSSSSPKRAASEGPGLENDWHSSRPDEMSAQSLEDAASQVETCTVSGRQTVDPTPRILISDALSKSMPSDRRFAEIHALCKQPMKIGETWYVVSRTWYRRWQKACTGEVDKEGGVDEKDIGPVDNTPLVDKDGNLISSVVEGVNAEFVPQEVWSYFVSWYGSPIHPLPRNVIPRGITQEPSLELHPLRLRVLSLTDNADDFVANGSNRYVTVSSMDSTREVCRRLASSIPTSSGTSYRIWRVDKNASEGLTFSISNLQSGGELVERSDRTVEDALIETDDTFVVEYMDKGSWLVDASSVSQVMESSTDRSYVPPPLFSSETNFFDRISPVSLVPKSVSSVSPENPSSFLTLLKSSEGNSATGTALKASSAAVMKSSRESGTLGLGNMGNTCFMNSALQCLAHTKELTEYFLLDVYESELNPDNPLGMHGAIAEAFGALLQRIWSTDGGTSSYSPREFKQQLQRFAPQFSGYQQHDSQELVAFLLDGLHEDLNRILKKPYVEKPDWEGGGDKELLDLARKSWDGYLLRNDSVIVDLFQGQYQSTLVCPECQKVSITFDPFMYLTLPLPIQKKWRHDVFYVPWDPEKPHVRVPVEIGRDSSFRDLRNLLGRWMGAIPDNLLTLEIFSHRFYKNLQDSVLCGEMSDNDVIVCFELPCHAQQSRSYKKSDNDPFILPMFLQDSSPARTGFTRSASLFGYPSVVVVTREQASSEHLIYDVIVDRLQRWTTNARDLFTWEVGTPESMEEVRIPISSSTPSDTVIEIKENGDVVTVHEDIPEGDITDERPAIVNDDDDAMDTTMDDIQDLRKTGAKRDLFTLRLQGGHRDFGAGGGLHGSVNQRYETWKDRREHAEDGVLLREEDAFFCEFDENMKAFYFGDERSQFELARWDTWEEFIHPEYTESKKTSAERKNKGISLQDCLDEFTKEEQLGEDDLWYCPRCKKHQQATKRFDLWKAPDVLVVHLKRFSNSRTLRDKIDTFVDFPIEGLDLGDMVGERKIAKNLTMQGADISELGLSDLDEPLLYDLFAVDEHLGGLGGGHYRAYALNHMNEKWYHFDDAFVTVSRASDAVNPNAYLLFYRRRTSGPLGGKTHQKIEQARLRIPSANSADQSSIVDDVQLPTPPNETSSYSSNPGLSRLAGLDLCTIRPSRGVTNAPSEDWPTPRSFPRSSPTSSAAALDDSPNFEDSQFDTPLDPLALATDRFEFPDPSSRMMLSPTSSNEAEPDVDDTLLDDIQLENEPPWVENLDNSPGRLLLREGSVEVSGETREWYRIVSPGDPAHSELMNPFSDTNTAKTINETKSRQLTDDTTSLDSYTD